MAMTPNDPAQQDKTRQRLLDAAGEVFADLGFHKATVRDICARAGANVAAVKYHFGDKERLYSEALRYAHGCSIAKYPPGLDVPRDAAPDRRLYAFVLSFLRRIFDEGRPAWHTKIITREMAEPTGAMDALVDQQIRPHFAYVREIVVELLGAETDDDVVRLCCQSVVGQCLFYHFGQPVTRRLFPQRVFGMADAEGVARHITRLTLAGVRELANDNGKPASSPAEPRAERARASGGARPRQPRGAK